MDLQPKTQLQKTINCGKKLAAISSSSKKLQQLQLQVAAAKFIFYLALKTELDQY